MTLNDVIAQGIQFKMPNMLEQYAQMQQLQGGVQANQLNQMKMQEMQRSLQEQEGLRNYLSTATDLTTPASRMEMLKHGATGLAYGKSLDEAQKAGMERQKASADLVDVKLKQSRQMLEGVTTPDQYLQWHQANHADPVLGKYLADRGVSAEQSRARIDAAIAEGPQAFQQMLNASKLGSEKAMENHFIESSSGQQKWTSTVPKYGTGGAQIIPGTIVNQLATPGELSTAATALAGQKVTERGQNITAATAKEGQRITTAGQISVAQTAANALKQAGDPVIQGNLAAARTTGETIAKDTIAAKAALPQIIADTEKGVKLIDDALGSAKVDAKTGKVTWGKGGPSTAARGFGSVGGLLTPLLQWVPGTATADYVKRHDQITGSAFLKAYETLRGAQAITDIEGAKGTAAITRMSMAQSPAEYIMAAKELQDIMKGGLVRAKAKASGAASIDSLLEKYK